MRVRPALLVAVLLVAVYAIRAVPGVLGGIAQPAALHHIDEGEYEQALPLLERATVGFNRADVLWWRASVRYGLWRRVVADDGAAKGAGREEPLADAETMLRAASADYLEALAVCPVAAWPWAGLAKLYDAAERGRPATREIDLAGLEHGSWIKLGREGRIAVGLLRKAIERTPSDFELWDQLAVMLHGYGLEAEALEAVRQSARAQPAYHFHSYRFLRSLPEGWQAGFADVSREMLGRAPMLRRERHLVALGKLELELGRLEMAEQDLRAALEGSAQGLHRAEAQFWLAQVLKDLERSDEARGAFEAAAEDPAFRVASIAALAELAETEGDLDRALRLLGEARRLSPRNVGFCLRYARIARRVENWSAAREALRWGILIAPDDPRPHVDLVELLLETDDVTGATVVLRDYQRRFGQDAPEVSRLGERIARRRAAP